MIKIIVICRHSAGMRADFLLLLPACSALLVPGALTSRTLAASRSGTPQLGLFDFLKKPSVAELIGEVANPAEFTPDELTALKEAR